MGRNLRNKEGRGKSVEMVRTGRSNNGTKGKNTRTTLSGKRPKTRSNPLLMSISANPPKKKKRTVRKNPVSAAPKGKEIPFRKFYRWAQNALDPKQLRRLNKAVTAYKKFHKGSEPKTVSREVVEIGGDEVLRDFVYSMGKSPTETYIPPRGSKKGRYTYLHEYGDGDEGLMPEGFATPGGKFVGKVLKGKTHIGEWIEH